MSRPTISLAMIAKDEDDLLSECLESVRAAVDEVIVVETDGALPSARRLADKVCPFAWVDDSAAARNFAFEQATCDWILWLDADDVVWGPEQLGTVLLAAPAETEAVFLYVYARDEYGNSVSELYRERLIKRGSSWRWHGRVHECMSPAAPSHCRRDDRVVVVHQHKRDALRSIKRNIRILESCLGESEQPDAWALQYLGREYASLGEPDRALAYYQQSLELPLQEELRYQILHRVAEIYRGIGKSQEAISADLLALRQCNCWADAYLGLAETYIAMEQWETALRWVEQGSRLSPPDGPATVIDPTDYSVKAPVLMAECLHQLGRHHEALEVLSPALDARPSDPQLVARWVRYEDSLEKQGVAEAIKGLMQALYARGEQAKLQHLVSAIPYDLSDHPEVVRLVDQARCCLRVATDGEAFDKFYADMPLEAPLSSYPQDFIEQHPRGRWLLTALQEQGASTVLDCGCSNGWLSNGLALRGYQVTGLDPRLEAVRAARRMAHDWRLPTDFVEGRVEHAARLLSPLRFDAVIATELLQYVLDPEAALRAIAALLAPGGRLYVSVPDGAWEKAHPRTSRDMRPGGPVRAFTIPDLQRLLAGWQIRELRREPNPRATRPGQAWILATCQRPRRRSMGTVAIAVPAQLGEWSPLTVDQTGLGGSETAVACMARELQRIGFAVTVYNQCGSQSGIYEGVEYRPLDHLEMREPCDILVSSRSPELLTLAIPTKARFLWCHDTHYGERLTAELAERADGIFLLSQAHQELFSARYPFLDPSQVVLTRNGLDLARFRKSVDRCLYRVVYSSSPDRGLEYALRVFSLVKREVPEAEFHVFYGWDYFDRLLSQHYDPERPAFKRRLTELLGQDGVVYRGRLPQDALAAELLAGSVWLYPTDFFETSCITAMEMQAAGVIPVTRRYGALPETVPGAVFVDGDPADPAVQEQYAEAVLALWRSPQALARKRGQLQRYACRFSWARVARQWKDVFLQHLSGAQRPDRRQQT